MLSLAMNCRHGELPPAISSFGIVEECLAMLIEIVLVLGLICFGYGLALHIPLLLVLMVVFSLLSPYQSSPLLKTALLAQLQCLHIPDAFACQFSKDKSLWCPIRSDGCICYHFSYYEELCVYANVSSKTAHVFKAE